MRLEYTRCVVVKVRRASKDLISLVCFFGPLYRLGRVVKTTTPSDGTIVELKVGIKFCVSEISAQTLIEPSQISTMGCSHQWYPRHLTWAIVELADGTSMLDWFKTARNHRSSSTTIESRKFRIPSDLRRQPGYRPVSSKVGDHLRILLGVVVYNYFLRWLVSGDPLAVSAMKWSRRCVVYENTHTQSRRRSYLTRHFSA